MPDRKRTKFERNTGGFEMTIFQSYRTLLKITKIYPVNEQL